MNTNHYNSHLLLKAVNLVARSTFLKIPKQFVWENSTCYDNWSGVIFQFWSFQTHLGTRDNIILINTKKKIVTIEKNILVKLASIRTFFKLRLILCLDWIITVMKYFILNKSLKLVIWRHGWFGLIIQVQEYILWLTDVKSYA